MFDRFRKQVEVGKNVRALMEAAKLSRDQEEDVFCALLADNLPRGRRQDEWPEAAMALIEKLRKHMVAAVNRRQIALANTPPEGHA